MNLVAVIEQIDRCLMYADMRLDASENDLFALEPFDPVTKCVAAEAREAVLFDGLIQLAEGVSQRRNRRTETLHILLGDDDRDRERRRSRDQLLKIRNERVAPAHHRQQLLLHVDDADGSASPVESSHARMVPQRPGCAAPARRVRPPPDQSLHQGQSLDFLGWLAVAGALLLLMALSSALFRRLPVTTSLVYLLCGIAIGPIGWNLISIDLLRDAHWAERLTEVAVIVSLFVSGLKIRVTPEKPEWRSAFLLAGPVMIVSIGAVALFGHYALGLAPGVALLLGSILAPTDPVLASSLSVSNAGDRDRLRYGLSVEAGLNDGAAFPFVILALLMMKTSLNLTNAGGWFLDRVLWAIPAGLAIGYLLGRLAGKLTIHLRSRHGDVDAPNDLLALALIALSYVAAEGVRGWGFLAVFAAGYGVRRAELAVVTETPHPDEPPRGEPDDPHPPAEELVGATVGEEELHQPAVAAGVVMHEVLTFGKTLERLLEFLLVILVGISIGSHWDVRGVLLGIALFLVIRPLASWIILSVAPTSRAQRALLGWFGIRGIGSLYYLCYAMTHGLDGSSSRTLTGLVITVVALSIVVHGTSAQPLLDRYEASLAKQDSARGTQREAEQ